MDAVAKTYNIDALLLHKLVNKLGSRYMGANKDKLPYSQTKVKPAKIINCFQSAEEQTEAASLFNSNLLGEVEEADRQKALLDTVYRMKEESLNRQSLKAIEDNDTELLQKIIREKADLKGNIARALR